MHQHREDEITCGTRATRGSDDTSDHARLRRRAVLICVATTAVVATGETAIGVAFGLISVTAEGLHTAADLVDSLVALLLIVIASKPADREHPFGHGKYDSLAAIIEGGFVGVTAIWALVKASSVLLGVAQAHPRPEIITLSAMAAASLLYIGVSGYVMKLAKRTRSPAVYAEAMHLRTHVYITIALVVGLGLSNAGLRLGWPHAERIDALAAVFLGVYLLAVAFRIVSPGFRQLMDTAMGRDELSEVVACLEEFRSEYVEIQALRARSAGTDRHVDFHLVVQGDMSVRDAHDLSHRIESRLVDRCPGTRLLVHIEPAVQHKWEAYLRRNRLGRVMVSDGSPIASEADHHDDPRAHEV